MLKLLNLIKHCSSCLVLLFLLGMSIVSNTMVLSISFMVLFVASSVVVYVLNQSVCETDPSH